MKPTRKHRLFAVLAMCLLLLGTAAPALERLSCSMGCPTTVSIGSVVDCCPEEHKDHGSSLMAADCCDVERTAPAHHAFTTENSSIHFELLADTPEREDRGAALLADARPGYALCTSPPPLLTSERLSLVSSFLL